MGFFHDVDVDGVRKNRSIIWSTYTPPTLIGAGATGNGEYQEGLQPMALTG